MRPEDRFDRLLLWIATRSSGRVISALAALIYAGFGLAVPLSLHAPVAWLVSANITATLVAGLLVLVWLAVGVQARHRRNLVEWTSDLRLLNAEEFEYLVGEVLRREGWTVEEVGSQSGPDGNVDLRVVRAGQRRLVQCKRWTSWRVGVEEVRAFAGTLLREGLDGAAGVFVTLSGFTDQAREEAKKLGIELVDNGELYRRVEAVRRLEPCPTCGSGMRLDRSVHGWWMRCVQPGCAGKRDLGREPARAVELLTRDPLVPS